MFAVDRQVAARIFLLADSVPSGSCETAVVSTALGAGTTAVQSMLAEETMRQLPVGLRAVDAHR